MIHIQFPYAQELQPFNFYELPNNKKQLGFITNYKEIIMFET